MKCSFCAGDISIDDIRCPHCDAENPHYKMHRKEMADYNRRFEATKDEVLKRTNRFAKRSVQIITLCILVLLIVISSVVLFFIRDINYEIEYRRNTKNAASLAGKLGELENEEEYLKMYSFHNSFYAKEYKNPLGEYSFVNSMLSSYQSFNNYINEIALDGTGFLKAEDMAKSISRTLDNMQSYRFDGIESKMERYPDQYSERHLKTADDLIENVNVMLKAYIGLSDEEVENIWTMSSAQRAVLLEEKMGDIIIDE